MVAVGMHGSENCGLYIHGLCVNRNGDLVATVGFSVELQDMLD
jgi:hypothetical protein